MLLNPLDFCQLFGRIIHVSLEFVDFLGVLGRVFSSFVSVDVLIGSAALAMERKTCEIITIQTNTYISLCTNDTNVLLLCFLR